MTLFSPKYVITKFFPVEGPAANWHTLDSPY